MCNSTIVTRQITNSLPPASGEAISYIVGSFQRKEKHTSPLAAPCDYGSVPYGYNLCPLIHTYSEHLFQTTNCMTSSCNSAQISLSHDIAAQKKPLANLSGENREGYRKKRLCTQWPR
ncbi:hypothetical protein Bbelb_258010 [Branchiostoma belcheri]|nr:hypothetical protein Bbelb_258010 [Branchiostoma belcheri]